MAEAAIDFRTDYAIKQQFKAGQISRDESDKALEVMTKWQRRINHKYKP